MNKTIKWILLILGLSTISLCVYWVCADKPEVEPWTIAIGAVIFIIGIFWPTQKVPKHSQSVVFGKKNKQQILNRDRAIEQSIVGGTDNFQVVGDVNIVNKQSPKLKLYITTKGASSRGITSKNLVVGTGEKLFTWEYDIKVINESSSYAYDVSVTYPNGNKFKSNNFDGNLGSIPPGGTINKKAFYEMKSNATGYWMKKLREEKYPDGNRDFLIEVEYKDADGKSYIENLRIDSDGEEV